MREITSSQRWLSHGVYATTAIVFVGVLTSLRQPELILDPRFWAEEGTVYFKFAYQNGAFQTLLAPQLGYFSLIANLGGAIASLVRISDAPFVTLFISFCIQISPFIILSLSDAPYLKTAGLKVLSILFLFLVMIGSETWLNTVNSQFVMLTVGGLILSSRPASFGSSVIRCVFLVIVGLSGPGSIAFIPLFWLAACQDRSSDRRYEALSMTFSGFIQICFLILAPKTVVRQFDFPLNSVLAWYTASVEGQLLGGQYVSAWLFSKFYGFSQRHALVFSSVAFVIQLAVIGILYTTSSIEGKRLLLSSLAVAAVSAFGAIVLGPERYGLAPTALLGMAVLNNFLCNPTPRFWSIGLGVVLACSVVSGVYDYMWARGQSGPSWRAQVTKVDWAPTEPIAIWPDTWIVELSE